MLECDLNERVENGLVEVVEFAETVDDGGEADVGAVVLAQFEE